MVNETFSGRRIQKVPTWSGRNLTGEVLLIPAKKYKLLNSF